LLLKEFESFMNRTLGFFSLENYFDFTNFYSIFFVAKIVYSVHCKLWFTWITGLTSRKLGLVVHCTVPLMVPYKVIMQEKLFQKCTHLSYCSVLSLGDNVNTRRMSNPDMGSIFHIKNQWNILVIRNYYVN